MATGYAVAFLGERHGSGIDLGTKEIIEAGPAGTVGPLVGGMLVGPSSVAAVLLDHFEDSVHAQVAVRVDRRAIPGGVAGQVVGIDAVLLDHFEDSVHAQVAVRVDVCSSD